MSDLSTKIFLVSGSINKKDSLCKDFNVFCEILSSYSIIGVFTKRYPFFKNKSKTDLDIISSLCAPSGSKTLKPSKRKETEIVDLIKIYLKKNNLIFKILNNIEWSDVGTIDDFNKISNFIKSKEISNKKKIGCLEEIVLKNKWINKAQVKKNIDFYGECKYSNYLKKI